MSGPFDEKFTDEQRDACAIAYVDGATAKDVAQAAADGRLRYRGKTLEPFEIKPSYIGSLGQRERKRRQGRSDSKVAELPHRDALEVLRVRSIAAADALLAAYEKTIAKRPENADPERLRQILRVQLEASRLPGPTNARTPSNGTRDENGKQQPRTTGGVAGALLREHRQTAPAQDNTQSSTDEGHSSATHNTDPRLNEQQDDGPGALPSEHEQERRALVPGG